MFEKTKKDQEDNRKKWDDLEKKSLLQDNYLVFSLEKIISHKKGDWDIDETETIEARIWITRDWAKDLIEKSKRDSDTVHVISWNPIGLEFSTWTLIVWSKSLKRTFFWVMSTTWSFLDYSTMEKKEDKHILRRHKEKLDVLERMLKV